ncbi:Iron-sulfur cluster assembly enzyme ISCU, mitochondrial [Capsicum annuum]|nr:Iron-sulfur cluster assembly enzyme ISCU, mitochondrial [Capsicum annuum]
MSSLQNSKSPLQEEGVSLKEKKKNDLAVEEILNDGRLLCREISTGLVGAPACGDVMKLQIKVDEKTGKIMDACFKNFGCGSAIASSSLATEWVKGRTMEEVLTIKNMYVLQSFLPFFIALEIAKHLSLPPQKIHCSMLAEDAIRAAKKDYEAKKAKFNDNAENAPPEKTV